MKWQRRESITGKNYRCFDKIISKNFTKLMAMNAQLDRYIERLGAYFPDIMSFSSHIRDHDNVYLPMKTDEWHFIFV